MTAHDHVARPRVCTGCRADEYVCARKSALGGRTCCDACTHVTTRKVQR